MEVTAVEAMPVGPLLTPTGLVRKPKHTASHGWFHDGMRTSHQFCVTSD